MFSRLKTLPEYIPIRPAFLIKVAVICFIMIYGTWTFILKRPVYQRIYGIPNVADLAIVEQDAFVPIPEQPIQSLVINGYEIEAQLIKRFETTTRVTYVDRYTSLGTWARAQEGAKLYDAVVPQDLSLATGWVGQHPTCFDFSHEYRLGESAPNNKCVRQNEFDLSQWHRFVSNNHTIAATPTVQKGLDILKAGDIVRIKGYLVYWNGTGPLRYQRFESAIVPNQVSKYIIMGQKAQLCRQLLLTELTFDGYTFR
ncbi:MAG: hypothetical protein IJV07_00385 [Alphaproteobacteria bacterium]|nr:hypothetical protein [Alphaproteobacteria bacterium]